MKEQNFSNHRQYVPGYHFLAFGILILVFLLSSYLLFTAYKNDIDIVESWVHFLITIFLFLIFFYARAFALKAQDRAIRAEEALRHYILTGNALDPGLNIKQIIALRFADDTEFPSLCKDASEHKFSPLQIKKSIKKWRTDGYRV
jgi:hypothetical protein